MQRRPDRDPLCVLDIEASGFGARSYPIEIGYVLGDGRAMCTLIRPQDEWTHWDGSAERVHGITRDTLLRAGRPVEVVAQMLNRDLARQTVYCDAWAHDYPWLALLFDAAGCRAEFRLESAARLLDEPALNALAATQRQALLSMGLRRHRASNDARALRQALLALTRQGATSA